MDKTPESSPRFYTVAEAARLLRISTITLYREIDAAAFPAIRIRRRLVVPAHIIDKMHDDAIVTNSTINPTHYASLAQVRNPLVP